MAGHPSFVRQNSRQICVLARTQTPDNTVGASLYQLSYRAMFISACPIELLRRRSWMSLGFNDREKSLVISYRAHAQLHPQLGAWLIAQHATHFRLYPSHKVISICGVTYRGCPHAHALVHSLPRTGVEPRSHDADFPLCTGRARRCRHVSGGVAAQTSSIRGCVSMRIRCK